MNYVQYAYQNIFKNVVAQYYMCLFTNVLHKKK